MRWARRKAGLQKDKSAVVNCYQMTEDIDGLKHKTFPEDLMEWIDFVCKCRDGNTDYKEYDLISGKVANDKVFRVVDLYRTGIWEKDRALKEIKAYPNYDQIAFITQKAIDKLLIYDSYFEVYGMDENVLEQVYQEKLEERIIAQLAKEKAIPLEKAMHIYYGSELADKIHNGMEGIQYLDYRVLVQILEETEPNKFFDN